MNEPDKEKFMTARYNGRDMVNKLDWHMDLHYTGKPNRGALLRAVVCASEDGLTGFGDLAKAYDALDEETRQLIANIEVTYAFSMQRRHMRYVDLRGYEPGPVQPEKARGHRLPQLSRSGLSRRRDPPGHRSQGAGNLRAVPGAHRGAAPRGAVQ